MPLEPQTSADMLKKFLKDSPEDSATRLIYAQSLLAGKQKAEFAVQAKILTSKKLTGAQWIQLGEMAEQNGELKIAETAYSTFLKTEQNAPADERNLAYIRLGFLSENQLRPEDALGWYEQVTDGKYYVAARLRSADIYQKTGRPDRAIAVLEQAKPKADEGKIAITTALSQLLNAANQPWQAYDAMQQTAKTVSNAPDFLYSTAMQSERSAGRRILSSEVHCAPPQFLHRLQRAWLHLRRAECAAAGSAPACRKGQYAETERPLYPRFTWLGLLPAEELREGEAVP